MVAGHDSGGPTASPGSPGGPAVAARPAVAAGWGGIVRPMGEGGRRIAVATGIVAMFGLAAAGPVVHLASLAGAGDWGSDWRWLADGLARLAAGQPLNHPEYVAAPFSQLVGGPAFTWSLHPPYNATLVAPLLLLPQAAREPAWACLMALALAAAVALAWPRRLWWGTQLLVGAAVLGPPLVGPSVGLVDQLHFANPNALVLLGLSLAWWGRSRARAADEGARLGMALMAAGLVLAAAKIVPAIGLAAWLLAARAEGRRTARAAVAAAVLVLVALTIPVLLLDPGVLGDTIAVQLNLVPWPGETNLAPGVRLAPFLGAAAATWLSRLVAAGLLGLVLARRLDGPGGFVLVAIAPLLLTPQLWAHWFLVPILAGLLAAGTWPPLLALDARLRASVGRGSPARPAGSR